MSTVPPLNTGRIKTAELNGAIDTVSRTEIRGWVCRAEPDERPLTAVVACSAGSLQVPITTYRPDLAAAGFLNANAGFAVPLARVIGDASLSNRPLDAAFLIKLGEQVLYHRTFILLPAEARAGRYRWAIDVVDCLHLAGWVVDLFEKEPVYLEVENLKTRRVAIIPADIPRRDLVEPFGQELAGFDLALPLDVRMRSDTLDISILNGASRIPCARIELPPLCGVVDSIEDGRFVQGWAINAPEPERRPVVEALVNGEVVASCFATIYRSDLRELTLEDGFFGFELITPSPVSRGDLRVRASLPTGDQAVF